jgi:hypothetical protein
VFTGAAAEEDANAESFFVRGHGICRFFRALAASS